jgi:hypothetical protein
VIETVEQAQPVPVRRKRRRPAFENEDRGEAGPLPPAFNLFDFVDSSANWQTKNVRS